MAGLLDFLQAASNSAAGTVSAPVDGIAWLFRKLGIETGTPVGGSDWMEAKGLTRPVQQSGASLAGETLGLLSPVVASAKAPQIAKGLLQGAENLTAPRTLNPQTGAIVWHGSPHKFDKFDSSKIGTGEGAQAYGHGLYLASNKDIGEFYRKALSAGNGLKPLPVSTINDVSSWDALPKWVGSLGLDGWRQSKASEMATALLGKYEEARNASKTHAQAMMGLEKIAKKWESNKSMPMAEFYGGIARRFINENKLGMNEGNLYKVDLPDSAISRMLDWDKPLSQQAPEVQKAVKQTDWYKHAEQLASGPQGRIFMPPIERRGADLYKMMSDADAQSAAKLRQAGIPGIRYLDGGSRGAGSGTSNFVVFPGEESLLTILERNGIPVR